MAKTIVTVNTFLSGTITVEIENVGIKDVNIEGESVYLFIVVGHVYSSLTNAILAPSHFHKAIKILKYRKRPQYLKVKIQ